ncbi:hypothetical protein ACFR9U_00305 [Halorientalis brevis]|uniref:Uncharacterized protein n=1 Tax=Halorientalis brevis TaxID=1126241 RepID=A0ABD6C561_9EURY|nr:hypothetical protein [Halorientalis brevis]
MVALQLSQMLSMPELVVGLVALVGVVMLVRFLIGLAIKVAIVGLVVLGTMLVLNQVLGLGLPGIETLLAAG